MSGRYRHFFFVCFSLLNLACSNQHQSQRDSQREQQRNQAELKRRELARVSGEYFGRLLNSTGASQSATLHLEVKDLPSAATEGVDARLVPSLSGYLQIEYGPGLDSTTREAFSFALSSSEFDPQLNSLSLVAHNASLGELRLELKQAANHSLKGQWIASGLAVTGTGDFQLASHSGGDALRSDFSSLSLQGEYRGYFYWEKMGQAQKALLTLTALPTAADSFQLSATLRLYFLTAGKSRKKSSGEQDNREYITYHFRSVQFNPLSNQLSFQDESKEISVKAQIAAEGLQGEWASRYTGNLGRLHLRKEASYREEVLPLVQALQGTYVGQLSQQKGTSLPETILITIVTAEQAGKNRELSLSGYVRFYWGTYPSHEYQEFPFVKLEYNTFTRQLLLTTENEYSFTFLGSLQSGPNADSLHLQLNYEPLGPVGNILATKVGF